MRGDERSPPSVKYEVGNQPRRATIPLASA